MADEVIAFLLSQKILVEVNPWGVRQVIYLPAICYLHPACFSQYPIAVESSGGRAARRQEPLVAAHLPIISTIGEMLMPDGRDTVCGRHELFFLHRLEMRLERGRLACS